MTGFSTDAGTTGYEAGFGYEGNFFTESTTDGLTAFAGGGQASATKLTHMFNRVATVASAADSVKLPFSRLGLVVCCINGSVNTLAVFPQTGETINGQAANAAISQMPNSVCYFSSSTSGAWIANGLGQGYAGSLPTFSITTGLTAFATGGQASATLMAATYNNVTVVATAGDSVKLPTAAIGLCVVVRNSSATNAMQVYGSGTDTINGVAFATGVLQDFATEVTYNCLVAGQWLTTPDAGKPSQYATGALQSATFPAGALTGAETVVYENTGTTPANLQTRTATQMFNDSHNPQVGSTYLLMIRNSSGSANTATITAGGGVTLSGTMTIAQNVTRFFTVTFTSATTLTIRSLGVSAVGA